MSSSLLHQYALIHRNPTRGLLPCMILIVAFLCSSCQFGGANRKEEKPDGKSAKKVSTIPNRGAVLEPVPEEIEISPHSPLPDESVQPIIPGAQADSTLFTLRSYREFRAIREQEGAAAKRDQIFADYLRGLPDFLDASNEKLYEHPNYEVYSAAVYESSEQVLPSWLKFRDSIRELGLKISLEEGVIYLREDPDFTDRFVPGLSPGMQNFARQYVRELQQPFWRDASIVVPVSEHVERLKFWDRFSREQTDSELRAYAYDRYQAYLFTLMFGTDNTPIYEWESSSAIRPELISAYGKLAAETGGSQAAPTLAEYLLFLEERNFRYEPESFGAYARRLFPELTQ